MFLFFIFIVFAVQNIVAEYHDVERCKSAGKQWEHNNTKYRSFIYKEELFAYVICSAGYSTGSTIKVRCVNGWWESPLPRCEKNSAQQCETLPTSENLVKQCEHGAPAVGKSCTFRCKSPYQLIGSNRRICRGNLQWTGVSSSCVNTIGVRRKSISTLNYPSRVPSSRRVTTDIGDSNRDVVSNNPCHKNNGGCDHFCKLLSGSKQCTCLSGYILENGSKCTEIKNNSASTIEFPHSTVSLPIQEVTQTQRNIAPIDLCRRNNGGCEQFCNSSLGFTVCSCRVGYELLLNGSCIDIDECHGRRNYCNQKCHNTMGGYYCSCQHGYALERKYVCKDINECLDPTKNVCSQECINIPGSFHCSCKTGYKLTNQYQCEDIDECPSKELNHCNQNCHNTDGSYYCSCEPGYILKNKYECEGCRKNSYNSGAGSCIECPPNSITDTEAKTSISDCQCAPGFTGSPSSNIPCEDIDECMTDNFGCSDTCNNTPGGAHCLCPFGLELQKDNKTCVDIEECKTTNGGCQMICQNFIGGFSCHCTKGFILSTDGYSCDDTDECDINNGGCSHMCINFAGGYYCSCPKGYRLDVEGKSCIAVRCPALAVPHHSTLRCFLKSDVKNKIISKPNDEFSSSPTDYPVDTVCRTKCQKGYDLIPSHEDVECLDSGNWNASTPQCTVSHCPTLVSPENGDIYPPICIEGPISVKQKCYFTCKTGFHLNEEKHMLKCKNDLKWTADPPHCEPDKILPVISCPEDITVELMSNESWANVTIPAPVTNMEKFEIFPEWVSAKESIIFSSGETDILFRVRSINTNATAQCIMTVHVIDKESPSFVQCPDSITVDGISSFGTPVTWEEPVAFDNVGIDSIIKNLEPNTSLTAGIHYVEYIAKDEAGNIARCSFEINVIRGHCDDLEDPTQGKANCMDWMLGKLCRPACDPGYSREPSEPKFFACGDSGIWTPTDNISPCLSECPNGTMWSLTSDSCEEF